MYQNVLNNAISVVMLWACTRWKPKLVFSFTRFKDLFSYGWRVLLTNLINTIYDDISILIIGKKYSTNELAFYDQGRKYPQVIVSNMNTSIDSVLFPVMAKEQNNSSCLKEIMKRTYSLSAYLLFPIMTGIIQNPSLLVLCQ